MTAPLQSEFSLPVAVCAWCKPMKRGADPGAGVGAISHGICPRHLKKLKLEFQSKQAPGHPAPVAPAPARKRRAASSHPELGNLA